MITSELSKIYLQEEDAVKGFKAAVENNQLRLAMQILTEIVDAFVEGFEAILEAGEEEQESPKAESKPVVGQSKQSEEQSEKKPSAKKSETKEEKPKDLQ
jgi:outer membrane biosynthesis protein TonB